MTAENPGGPSNEHSHLVIRVFVNVTLDGLIVFSASLSRATSGRADSETASDEPEAPSIGKSNHFSHLGTRLWTHEPRIGESYAQ